MFALHSTLSHESMHRRFRNRPVIKGAKPPLENLSLPWKNVLDIV